MSSVATRPRFMTSHSPTSTRTSHFRPIRYQTKEELDRFFGTTSVQKREQRLRVRESDGQVFFDWIEKDEWQHLLATGSLTSPNSPAEGEGKRRSSAATFCTLNSPLSESLVSPSTPGLSPLTRHFGDVGLGGEGGRRERGRKRSCSQLAGRMVDGETALGGGGMGFKRRQSDGFVPSSSHEGDAEQTGNDRIRIARLPLSHRRLNQETLDEVFAVQNPLLDLSPNATLLSSSSSSRLHKPAALHIPEHTPPDGIHVENQGQECENPLTFDSSARRGTFGSLFPPLQPVQVLTASPKRMRHQSDVGTPPSSAAMEFLASPTPTTANSSTSSSARPLRHAVSFDTPRQPVFVLQQPPAGALAQRQRWHSADRPEPQNDKTLRSVRSVASLRQQTTSNLPSAVERVMKMSHSSEGSSCGSDTTPCWTPLAPRTGAKKFDRTRFQHLNSLPDTSSPSSTPSAASIQLPPMKDPITPPEVQKNKASRVRVGVGLRTGPEVYDGIDIPCASIHLHSDPEDNLEPAVAIGMSARELKKKKKTAATQHHARCASSAASVASSTDTQGQAHAKGSSRWWNHIRPT